jgi:hypothetical protein
MKPSSILAIGLVAPVLTLALGAGVASAQVSVAQAQAQEEAGVPPKASKSAHKTGVFKLVVESRDTGAKASSGKRIELIVEARVDTHAWESRLTSSDLDARELAFDELVNAARTDISLRYALQAWALDPSRNELAWSARMALREVDRQDHPLRVAWVPRSGKRQPVMFQLHEPHGGAASAPDSKQDGNLRDMQFTGDFPLSDHRMLSLSSRRVLGIPMESRSPARRQGRFELNFQPEGVTLVVTEFSAGKAFQRTYAGASIEQLLRMYPDLRGKVPALSHINTQHLSRPAQQGLVGMVQLGPSSSGLPSNVEMQVSLGTRPAKVLGVKCTALTVSEAERRLLGPGVGLLIEGRVPGSIAEALNLQRGEILVELLGQQLCSTEEISRLMDENSSHKVIVKIIDRDGIEAIRSWSPSVKPGGDK